MLVHLHSYKRAEKFSLFYQLWSVMHMIIPHLPFSAQGVQPMRGLQRSLRGRGSHTASQSTSGSISQVRQCLYVWYHQHGLW